MTSYKAWIPTNTGMLSFSQAGKQYHNKKNLYVKNCVVRDCRKIFCIEKRTLKLDDSVFKFLTKFQTRTKDEETYFSLRADSKNRNANAHYLTGVISCKYGYVDIEEFIGMYDEAHPVFRVKFCLTREGRCKIYDFKGAPNLEAEGDNEGMQEYLCSQAYMFLRDMLHRHKHHHHSSDTFIDIKPNDRRWKKLIAYDLGKHVIKQPIRDKTHTYQDALGIISYLDSFQTIFLKEESDKVYSDQHIVATQKSLEAEYNKITKRHSDLRWFFGIIMTIYVLAYSKLTKDVEFLTLKPLIGFCVLVLLFLFAAERSGFSDIRENGFIKSILVLFNRHRTSWSIMSLIASLAGVLFSLYGIMNWL